MEDARNTESVVLPPQQVRVPPSRPVLEISGCRSAVILSGEVGCYDNKGQRECVEDSQQTMQRCHRGALRCVGRRGEVHPDYPHYVMSAGTDY